MPTTCDLSRLVALQPTSEGATVRLALPGYQPGKKPRSQDNAPLCGVFVHADQPTGPLAEALLWVSQGDGRRLCRSCVGHLCSLLEVDQLVVRLAMLAQQADLIDDVSVATRMAVGLGLDTPHGHG